MTINELFDIARSGDQEVEKQLYDKLYERFQLILRHKVIDPQDIEEILQDSLITIARKAKDIEFRLSFTEWAYKVLENNIMSYYRAKGRERSRFRNKPEYFEYSASYESDPSLIDQLLKCLKKVNNANVRHARILNFTYQGYNIEYICEKLNLTRSAMYTLLSRARSMLRTCLEKGEIK